MAILSWGMFCPMNGAKLAHISKESKIDVAMQADLLPFLLSECHAYLLLQIQRGTRYKRRNVCQCATVPK